MADQVKTILISGASIAGPTLAWWLHRRGFVPVLVEKAPAPRPGGHAIDVRGAALDILRAMGLEGKARERRTRMNGVSMIDAAGNEVWRSEEFTISGGSFGKEAIEILRDDMSNVLVSALPKDIEIIYGDSISALDDGPDGLDVTFASGTKRSFSLVAGADGLSSNVRNLAFGADAEFLHPFGIVLAPFSTPNTLGFEDWQLSYRDGKDGCMIYTARENTELRICMSFEAMPAELPSGRAEQLALVREKCGHLGWKVPEFLDAIEAARDFYLGPIAQVKMNRWTKGRVALIGDAGYCPSPYSGQGTSLAIVGAYVLAWELSCSPDDHAAAFARYDAVMRPFVDMNHAITELTRDERMTDPAYYAGVIEPAVDIAQDAIVLDGLDTPKT